MRIFARLLAVSVCLSLGCLALAQLPPGHAAAPPGDAPNKPLFETSSHLGPTDPFDSVPTQSYRKVYEQKFDAGRPYLIEASSPRFPALVRVEALDGSAAALPAPRLVFVPKKAGTYRVIATSQNPRVIGPFTLRIQGPDGKRLEKVDALIPEGPADREPTARYCQRFPQKLTGGEFYLVELESPAFDTQVRVESPGGAEVAVNRGGGGPRKSRLTFVPQESGTYTLVATSTSAGATGPFTLTLRRPGTVAGVAALDKEGSLSSDDPLERVATRSHCKVYEHKLDAGRTYALELTSAAFEPYLRVEDATGRALLQSGGTASARGLFSPPRTDTYRIIATSRAPDRTGPFALTILATDEKDGAAQQIAGRIGPGSPLHRLPTMKYARTYEMKLTGSKVHVFEVKGKGLAPHVFVEDETGRAVARSAGDVEGREALLSFTPPVTGLYKVVVTSVADQRTGPFTLTVLTPSPAAPAPLAVADQFHAKDIHDAVPTQKRHKAFPIELIGGKVYDIDMTSPDFESYLYVQSKDGLVLAQEGTEGKGARVRFSPPKTGPYVLIATSAEPRQTGIFALRVNQVPAPAKAAPALFSKDDKLTKTDPLYLIPTRNYRKAYDCKLASGRTYLIAMQSPDLGPYVRLEDGEHNVLGEATGNSQQPAELLFHCKRSGAYRVVASSTHNNQVGPFTLKAGPFAVDFTTDDRLEEARPLTLPTPWRTAELSHRFEVGKRYLVQIDGLGADAVLRQGSAAAAPGLPTGPARLVFSPASTGEHRFTVLSRKQGPFTAGIRPLVAQISQPGSLESADPRDDQPTLRHGKAYVHALVANQPYALQVRSKAFDPVARVLDAKGMVLARSTPGKPGEAAVAFTPTVGGPHKLVVSSGAAAQTGPFHVLLRPLVSEAVEANRLTAASPFDATPTGQVCKIYKQDMAAKQAYLIEMRSKGLQPRLRLTDARGRTVATAQSVLSETAGLPPISRILFTPVVAGTYHITATTFTAGGLGPFTLTVQPFAPATTKEGALAATDSFDRQPTLKYCKTYRQKLKQGEAYFIEMSSKMLDPVIRLEDAKGNQLKYEDRGGKGTTERMLFIPERSDEYKIVATTFLARETGPFALKIVSPRTIVAETGKLAATDFFDPLMNLSYQKVHPIKVKAGEVYLISLESKAFAPYLRLESARGQHLKRIADLTSPGAAHIQLLPTRDETYRVIVTSAAGGATGDYRLAVKR